MFFVQVTFIIHIFITSFITDSNAYWYPLCGKKCSVFTHIPQMTQVTFKMLPPPKYMCCLETSVDKIIANTLSNGCNPISCYYLQVIEPTLSTQLINIAQKNMVLYFQENETKEYNMRYYLLLIFCATVTYWFFYLYFVKKLIKLVCKASIKTKYQKNLDYFLKETEKNK